MDYSYNSDWNDFVRTECAKLKRKGITIAISKSKSDGFIVIINGVKYFNKGTQTPVIVNITAKKKKTSRTAKRILHNRGKIETEPLKVIEESKCNSESKLAIALNEEIALRKAGKTSVSKTRISIKKDVVKSNETVKTSESTFAVSLKRELVRREFKRKYAVSYFTKTDLWDLKNSKYF